MAAKRARAKRATAAVAEATEAEPPPTSVADVSVLCLLSGAKGVKQEKPTDAAKPAAAAPVVAQEAKPASVAAPEGKPTCAKSAARPKVTCPPERVDIASVAAVQSQAIAIVNSERVNLTTDKPRYNKFNYKLRSADSALQEQWRVWKSQEAVDPAGFDAFVDSVIALTPGDKIASKRTFQDVSRNKLDKEWVPWQEAARKEGEDVLLAQVRARTVEARPHPRLLPGSGIEWPKNLQIKYLSERDVSETVYVKEEESKKEIVDDMHPEASDKFDSRWSNRELAKAFSGPTLVDTSSEASVATPGGSTAEDALRKAELLKQKTAIGHVRVAHRSWDSASREIQSLIKISAGHEYTRGCKFEDDMSKLIKEGQEIDDWLMALDLKFLRGDTLEPEELATAAGHTTSLKRIITEARKIQTTMKPWLKFL